MKALSLTIIVLAIGALLPGLVAMALVRFGLERAWPAGPARKLRDDPHNGRAWACWFAGRLLLAPPLGGLTTLAVNRLGGGLIALPAHGWGLALGALVYLAVMDLGEYAFHRAQHAAPWLWALHSLHHSDTQFDTTTTVRHFWLDPVLKGVSVWLAVGLLFKAATPIVAIYGVASLYNYLIHSNTRIDFGRWSFLLNAPAYHRIHHSRQPEHFNANFAALLPIYDVMFGGYRPARPGERPPTGLDTGETPKGWRDVALWPVRHLSVTRPRPPMSRGDFPAHNPL